MLTADEWPIAAAMLPFGDAHPAGGPDGSVERWRADLTEPRILREKVERGDLGVKAGRGFLATPSQRAGDVTAYRDGACAALSALLDRLGTAPVEY